MNGNNNKVAISAQGGTKFSTGDSTINDLMFSAVKNLFENNPNIEKKDIDIVLVSTNGDTTKYLGAITSENIGIEPKITHNIESMCSSGTSAIVSAYSYIASGLGNAALVIGADRFDGPGQILQWDQSRGQFKHPVFWASLFSKSYKRAFDVKPKDLAVISAKNHKNAQNNPNAISDTAHTIQDILESKELTSDLRLLECSRPSTGASAVLLTSEEITQQRYSHDNNSPPVWITGIGQKTTSAGFTKMDSYTKMQSTIDASKQAFDMAKITPSQVDVAELHDAFAVCEALAVEDIGIVSKGQGAKFCNGLYETENKMINPRGGLIGAGHPLGATGIAQTAEIVQQLQNKAVKRQVPNPKIGLVHNMSAAATSSTVLVLSN